MYIDWGLGELNGGIWEGCFMLNGGKYYFYWNDVNCYLF